MRICDYCGAEMHNRDYNIELEGNINLNLTSITMDFCPECVIKLIYEALKKKFNKEIV